MFVLGKKDRRREEGSLEPSSTLGANVMKLLTSVTFEFHNKLVFALCKTLQPSLLFVDKARQEPTLEWKIWKVFHLDRLLPYPQTICYPGKACKGLTV